MNYNLMDEDPNEIPQTQPNYVALQIQPPHTSSSIEMIKPHKRLLVKNLDGQYISHECAICFETKEQIEFFESLPCSDVFCLQCLCDYIEAKIGDNKILEIKCPSGGCNQLIDDLTIERILDQETFTKYKQHKEVKLLSRNQNIRYCPNPKCSKPLSNHLGEPSISCSCGTKICTKCWQVSHSNLPCSKDVNADMKALFASYDIRSCTICKTPAQKIEGCPIMVCPICDYHWCWNCGRHHELGHEFVCKKQWDPVHPDVEHKGCRGQTRRILLKSLGILTHVAFFFLMPLFAIFFWPIMTIFKDKMSLKKPGNSILIVLANFAISIVLAPLVAIIVVGAVVYQFFKYQLPWILFCLQCKCLRDSKIYRWKNKNSSGDYKFQEKHNFPHAIALG